MGTPGERSLSTPNPTYRTDNRNHVGRPSDLAHAQVYPQPAARPQADGRRRPPPISPERLQGRAPDQAQRALQERQGPGLRLRFPDTLRWWQEHGLRAPLQARAVRHGEQDREGQQTAAQAEEEPLEGVPRYGQDQGCFQGQEEIRVCWLLALRWLHDGRGWRIWQTVLWLSWLVCLHDLVRKRYQHGVHHAMGVTHRSYQRLFAQASWNMNLEMTSHFCVSPCCNVDKLGRFDVRQWATIDTSTYHATPRDS